MRIVLIIGALLLGFSIVFVPGYFFHISQLIENNENTDTQEEVEDVDEITEEITEDPGAPPVPDK